MATTTETTGSALLVESLEALGAETVFGVPGIHALAIWDRLGESSLRTVGMRTELCAGFAADGYARAGGKPAVLLLSTGPGALNSLTALMEAASAHVPLVAITSHIPADLVGKGRGYLHELPDQIASFAAVVKWSARAASAEEVPALVAAAWREAQRPPSGPVYLEVPVDLLTAAASGDPAQAADGAPPEPELPPAAALDQAAELLAAAERPVIWAGGGVLRSGAEAELVALAERLRAPVATTYMGKGAIAEEHPLAAGSGCDEAAFQELLAGADVLLCVGTELGAETTGQYKLDPSGRLIQIDAAAERIGATWPALGLVGDARLALAALAERLPERPPDGRAERAVEELRARIGRGLDEQGAEVERGLLEAIRAALPAQAVLAWDMTILGYWAAAHFPALEPRRFLYPLGSGTLGYAWPAALGAKLALPDLPVLAVVGDGGIMYGLQELASARQHGIAAKLLIVDDGGYGILREYQRDGFGRTHSVDLVQPDFAAVCAAFGVPSRASEPKTLPQDLAWALEQDGPATIVLPTLLRANAPTA